MEKGILLAL
jgi:hypothetical protein